MLKIGVCSSTSSRVQQFDPWDLKPRASGVLFKDSAFFLVVDKKEFDFKKSFKQCLVRVNLSTFDHQEIREQLPLSYRKVCQAKIADKKKLAKEFILQSRLWLRKLDEAKIPYTVMNEQEFIAYLDAGILINNVGIQLVKALETPLGCRILGRNDVWPALSLYSAQWWFILTHPVYDQRFWAALIIADAALHGDEQAFRFLQKNSDKPQAFLALTYLHERGMTCSAIQHLLTAVEFSRFGIKDLQFIASADISEDLAEEALLTLFKKSYDATDVLAAIVHDSPHSNIQKQAFSHLKLELKHSKKSLKDNDALIYLAQIARDKKHCLSQEALALLRELAARNVHIQYFTQLFLWLDAKQDHRTFEPDISHLKNYQKDRRGFIKEFFLEANFDHSQHFGFIKKIQSLAESQHLFSEDATELLRCLAIKKIAAKDADVRRELGWQAMLVMHTWLSSEDLKRRQQTYGFFCGLTLQAHVLTGSFALEVMYHLRHAWLEEFKPLTAPLVALLNHYFPSSLSLCIYAYVAYALPYKNIAGIEFIRSWVEIGQQALPLVK